MIFMTTTKCDMCGKVIRKATGFIKEEDDKYIIMTMESNHITDLIDRKDLCLECSKKVIEFINNWKSEENIEAASEITIKEIESKHYCSDCKYYYITGCSKNHIISRCEGKTTIIAGICKDYESCDWK